MRQKLERIWLMSSLAVNGSDRIVRTSPSSIRQLNDRLVALRSALKSTQTAHDDGLSQTTEYRPRHG